MSYEGMRGDEGVCMWVCWEDKRKILCHQHMSVLMSISDPLVHRKMLFCIYNMQTGRRGLCVYKRAPV